jgi:tetratricopeptide (TPR) repeat protein
MTNIPNSAANTLAAKLGSANENAWLRLGSLGERMNDLDKALYCYENTLRHNPYNIKALTQIASIHRTREQYPKVPLQIFFVKSAHWGNFCRLWTIFKGF